MKKFDQDKDPLITIPYLYWEEGSFEYRIAKWRQLSETQETLQYIIQDFIMVHGEEIRETAAECMRGGAKKYGVLNWANDPFDGKATDRIVSAALRHVTAEELRDAESGLQHAAHCLANLWMAYTREAM
jgi:hypothetical protein